MKNFNFRIFNILVIVICLSSCKKSQDKYDHKNQLLPSGREYILSVNNGDIKKDTLKGSPETYSMILLKNTHLHITYSSPGVKGRVIWGGLLPYNEVWVSGAHKATTININHAIKIQNQIILPGEYALFTIPSKGKWLIILNSDTNQHLADNYNKIKDVARFEIEPTFKNKFTPRLVYTITQINDSSGIINLEWDKLKLSIPFKESN